jgi:PKD repeat protein
MNRFLLNAQVLALLFLLKIPDLYSQPFVEQTGISLHGVSASSVIWGDYNNDGNLDILLTGSNISKIYQNNGNNVFTEQTSITLAAIWDGSVAWGDYDNDGDLDILLSGSEISKIYRNNSDNSFSEQTNISLPGVSNGSVSWADYDNDGDLDILLTGSGNSNQSISKLYRNNGNNSFTEQINIPLTGVSNSSVDWGDYDNDGDLDILLTGYSGISSTWISKIYRNNADNTFIDQTTIALVGGWSTSVVWGDYDNDGDLDILVTSPGISRIYRNNSDNTFTEMTGIIILPQVDQSSVAWGDYDNDGDLDILFAGEGISQVYRNNGDNSFSEQTIISLPGVSNGSVSWADYDNDGDLDIMLTGSGISKIYRNELNTPNVKPSVPSNLQVVINYGNATFTWDKALDTETPQNGLSYNLYVYESGQTNYKCPPHAFRQSDTKNGKRLIAKTGNIQWSSSGYTLKNLPPDKTYYWSVQAVDAGLQGGNFSAEQNFTIPLYIPQAQADCISFSNLLTTQVTTTWVNGGGVKRAVFLKTALTGTADPVDNTNYLVNSTTPGGWKCVYNGTGNSFTLTGLTVNTNYLLHVCEYNGTTGSEKYLKSSAYQNPTALSTVFTEQNLISLAGINSGSVAWGDYDKDGNLDILLTGNIMNNPYFSPGSKIYHNNGNNTFSEQSGIILTEVYNSSVAWGDYDNDGDLDILLTGAADSGPVSKIYRNNGTNSFTEQTQIVLTGVKNSSVSWGDYDNDGDLDILLTGWSDSGLISEIYRNNGDNSFTKQTNILLPGVYKSSVCWGDYDNDGDLDILLSGASSRQWPFNLISKIYNNNGNNGFIEQNEISLTGIYQGSIAWGDYDNDSYLDILLTGWSNNEESNYSYISEVYRNNGNNSFTKQTNILLPGMNESSATWGDYDNDGDLDILLAGATGSSQTYNPISKIYQNNGDNTFTEQAGITLTGVFYSFAAWGNYDNDGDLDILLTGSNGSVTVSKIFRNEISNSNVKPSVPTGLQSFWINDTIIFKWNKSTDNTTPIEALTYNLRVGTSAGGNQIRSGQALSTGKLLLTNINSLTNDTCIKLKLPFNKYYWSVQAVDKGYMASSFATEQTSPLDSIQAKDLQGILRTSNSLLIRWENGNGLRRTLFGRLSSVSGSAIPIDGKTYHAEPYLGQGDQIGTTGWYCMYDGKADSALIYGIDEEYSYDLQVVEYIIINNLPVYFNTIGNGNPGVFSTSLFSEQTGIVLPVVTHESVAWGDYNNDGYLDILLTGNAGPGNNISKIYRNNGNNVFIEQTGISLTGVSYGSAGWVDYDNDGNPDIILTGQDVNFNYLSKIYRNNGNNTFTEQTGIALAGVVYGSFAWGDYDNDNDLDILLTGAIASDPDWITVSKIYTNNGNNNFTEQTQIVLPGVMNSSVSWGDYDNNGDLDIVLIGHTGIMATWISKIYRNNGDNTFTDQTCNALVGEWSTSAVWGDYDNDSYLDILIKKEIYRNLGDKSFTPQISLVFADVIDGYENFWLEGEKYGSWGDYNNDGDLDIALAGNNGSTYICKIYRNNGNNSFTSQVGIELPQQNSSSPAWGDYDNDGDLDILLGYKVYRNNTFMKAGIYPANIKPDAPVNLLATAQPNGTLLSWSPVRNDETPFKTMTYNVRIGSTRYRSDICTPQADTSGYRRIVTMGNAQMDTTFLIKNLSTSKFYWSVQAVDQGYQGGAWSVIDSFEVKNVQAFYSYDEVCLGYPTHFTDQSVATDGIASWKWDFKDGSTSSDQNPVHTYITSGAYKVKLVITDNTGVKDSLEQKVIVRPKPLTGFSASDVCQGIPLNATNTTNNKGLTISSWNWDFGDGSTSTDQQPAPHGYLNAGDYNMKLRALASNGCADSVTNIVSVGTYPIAAVTANAPLTFCKGDSVILSVPYFSSYIYDWMVGGTRLTGSDSSRYIAKLTGSCSVKVINPKGNCTTTSSAVAITAKDAPVAPLISTDRDLIFCQGDSVVLSVTNTSGYKYQWKLNGGAIGTDLFKHSAKSSGTYSLTVTNSTGCTVDATNTINVTVNPKPTLPTVNISGSTTFCDGSNVELSVTNNIVYKYQWENNGATLAGDTTNTYTAQTSGVYSLKISSSNGCYTKTDNVTVNLLTAPATPSISASKATEFCQGDSIELSVTNTAGYSYQWKRDGGAVGLNSSKFTAKNSGTYSLTVTNASNCSVNSTNSVIVAVIPAPSAGNISLDGKETFCEGGSVTLSVPVTTGYTYNWRNESELMTGTNTNSYTAAESGTYQLEISNSSGCKTITSPIKIIVKPSPDKPDIAKTNYTPKVCPGDDPIRLSVSNTASGYRYQWIKDGIDQKNDTLSFIEFYERGIYKLKMSLGECSVESDTIPIILPESPAKPVIYVQGPTLWYLACSSMTAKEYRWYCNGELIEGAKSYFYVAGNKVGLYQVSISNIQGCFTRSDVYAIPTGYTGTGDIDLFEGLSIYPNPTTGLFTVEIDNNIFGELLISIITEQGREMSNIETQKTTEHYKTEIDLSSEAEGVYFIFFRIDKYLTTRKVIIE